MRLLRLGQPRLGLLGAGLKPGPGLLARRDLRFQPGPLSAYDLTCRSAYDLTCWFAGSLAG